MDIRRCKSLISCAAQILIPNSLLVRATEVPGQYWLFLSGNVEPDQIRASDETFKKALRDVTERDDLVWGRAMHVIDYRYVY